MYEVEIACLQRNIAEWADEVYPHRTAHDALAKLMLEEIPELIHSELTDPLEFADVVILVLDIAHLSGINISEAVQMKMEINRNRKWGVDGKTGLLQHVKESKDE